MQTEEYKTNQRKLAVFQKRMREAPTKAELAVKLALEKAGLRFTFQKGFLRGHTLRIVDFYLTKPYRISLEVDGAYHEKQKHYDVYREEKIRAQRATGITFIRVTNDWVFSQNDLTKSLLDTIADNAP